MTWWFLNLFTFNSSNLSGDQQTNNAFYNAIDSAPDIPDGKVVPLGLDMVRKKKKIWNENLLTSYCVSFKGISVAKLSAGVPSTVGRQNDEELVNKSVQNVISYKRNPMIDSLASTCI